MPRFKNMNDVLAGSFLIVMAILGLALSWRLNSGTSAAMGPGYVPKLLCFVQIALGAAAILYNAAVEGDPLEAWFPRPLFWVLVSVAFFGMSVERLGLFIAVVGLVLLSCLGYGNTKPHEAIALAIGMGVFAVLVFVTGLGLPIPIKPQVF